MDLDGFADIGVQQTSRNLGENLTIQQALKVFDDHWYALTYRSARWMDLIGDYGGNELFIIDGESLLQQVLDDPLLAIGQDGDCSFQILHAYYSLEQAILEFKRRSANFEIVFWQAYRHSTIKTGSSKFVVSSRLLARTMLFKHLMKIDGLCIRVFDDLGDPEWKRYSVLRKPMFVMANDGGVADKPEELDQCSCARILDRRLFLFHLLASGISFAHLNGAEYREFKILTFVNEQNRNPKARKLLPPLFWKAASLLDGVLEAALPNAYLQVTLSICSSSEITAEDLLIDLSRSVKKSGCGGKATVELLYLFLLHCVVLPGLTSSSRARSAHKMSSLSKVLTESFLPTVFVALSQLSTDVRSCIDVDGRVFSSVISFASTNSSRNIPDLLSAPDFRLLHSIWSQLRYPKPDLNSLCAHFVPNGHTSPQKMSAKTRSLLLFENEIFDSVFSTVKVTVQNTEGHEVFSAKYFSFAQGTPFKDDKHWHNQNSIVSRSSGSSKRKKLGFYARRRALQRNQKFMQRLQDQAATLTGASGAVLQQMVIAPTGARKVPQAIKDSTRINAKKKHEAKLSSADKIRKEIQAEKATKLESEAQSWWKEHLKAMSKIPSRQKATQLQTLFKNKKSGEPYLHLEMLLYQLYLEFLQWIDEADHDSNIVRDQHTVAIVRTIKDICDGPLVTPSAAKFLKTALRVIGLEEYIPTMVEKHETAPDKRLSFKPIDFISKTQESHFPYMHIQEDPMFWQLRVFGEFMDRSMDGSPDPRVAFIPDAWQRTVLDSIDSNHSLLVVAPTSAGKTFISFYAMEKVLRESDDAILVYVAPTKPLVTQVAAEIYARFSKTLANGSCWAIHTRDYRIHDPLHCQILVTVPEILVIMLLSPSMSRNWTSRIKWIVLDEIHCIGQQEGGSVWEQIILFAPCPVIGLSATIGSPDLFNNWLRTVQEAHGFKHTFVQHPYRYSHLRKFYYLLDANRKSDGFSGLSNHQPTSSMRFLHPISMMSFGARTMPSDLALEARDTLTLYQVLALHTKLVNRNINDLEPRQFFAERKGQLLTQKDIIRYETALKDAIAPAFATFDPADSSSPVHRFLKDLTDPLITSVSDMSLSFIPRTSVFLQNLIYLAADLHAKDYLPAILFSFDRTGCEKILKTLLDDLEDAEKKWRQTNPERNHKIQAKTTQQAKVNAKESHVGREPKWKRDDDFKVTKTQEITGQSSTDLYMPVERFSFANMKVYSQSELDNDIAELSGLVQPWILRALKRGIAVHHSGMNKGYRALVESLFRLRFVRVLISTGTLALGINAPTKTCVFVGDSPYLTALMYRQCSGRAGRRGYDLLGNVIFYGLTMDRVQRLVLSKLPTLGGNFPLTSTLVLRLCNLLHGSNNASVAVNAIRTISSLPSICFGSEVGRDQILHHLRFSIEYLRRSHLLDGKGKPMNLYAIAAHLYYTEPSNLALVALMHSGILHRICAQNSDIDARRDYIHLMSHLFGRRYISRITMNSETMSNIIRTYPSMVVLPPLPEYIRATLKNHDRDVLHIFTSYVVAYVKEHEARLGMEDSLPLSGIRYTKSNCELEEQAALNQYLEESAIQVSARSTFVANSGHGDHFKSVSELARTVRQGVYLNQHAIPSMTHLVEGGTQEHELNAYLLDFYTHGQTTSLTKANGIRSNDVWFLLEDFALTLSLIKAALEQLFTMNAKAICETSEQKDSSPLSSDGEDNDDVESDSGYGTLIESHLPVDEDGANEKPENAGYYLMKRPIGVSNADWRVYEVVSAAREEFMEKHKAKWA